MKYCKVQLSSSRLLSTIEIPKQKTCFKLTGMGFQYVLDFALN